MASARVASLAPQAKKEKALEKTLADQAQARRDKNKMARARKMAVAAKKSEGAQPSADVRAEPAPEPEDAQAPAQPARKTKK